jgi:hypothetical protein
MRNFLLFLLVFSLGLILLLLLQSRSKQRPAVEPKPATNEVETPPPSTETPAAGPQVPRGSVSGRVTIQIYDKSVAEGGTGFQQYVFKADLEPQGSGRYIAVPSRKPDTPDEHLLEMYDSTKGTLLQTIDAERARLRIEADGSSIKIADGGAIALEGVVVHRVSDSPFAPIEVRSPTLEGSLETRSLHSSESDTVSIEGRGLTGSGRGFVLREGASQLGFERGGQIELALEGGGRARLASKGIGPIRITRVGAADEERYDLEATEDAEISYREPGADPAAEPSFSVSAERIVLHGKRGAEAFELERADTMGSLVVKNGASHFQGGTGVAVFDATGRPERIEIDGNPSGTLFFPAGTDAPVEIQTNGEGKLTVRLLEPARFRQIGPAELRIPLYGAVVSARDDLGASIDETTGLTTFDARGDVRLTQSELHRVVETDRLQGTLVREGEGELRLVGLQRTHVLVQDDAGNPIDLLADGRLEFVGQPGKWRVPLAENARVAREGENAFQASATRVLDLDGTQQSFVVEGEVVFSSKLGHGKAVRAVATGPEHLELLGIPGASASFQIGPDLPSSPEVASFEAQEIDVFADRLEARGNAIATVHSIERDYHLAAEFVRLTVEPLDPVNDARPFTLECEKVTEARMSQEGRETTCSANSLLATGLLREKAEPARRLEASKVTATGHVEVHDKAELELSGAGELFTIDADGKGRLETRDDRQVSAWGRFGGTGVPYQMNAKSVLFDSAQVEAEAPRIYLDATLLPVQPKDGGVAGFTEASGDRLRVESKAIWLIGNAHVKGIDRTGMQLVIDAAAIRIDGDVTSASDRDRESWISGIEATGGFEARYEARGYASGDSFLFNRERAVMIGKPANLSMDDLHLSSDQIDVDLQTFLMSTKSGAMWSDGPGMPWRVEFASMRPVPRGAETLFVLRDPSTTQGDVSSRATWAVAWIDVAAWALRGNEALWGKPPEQAEVPLPHPLMPKQDLYDNPFRRIVNERAGRYVEKLYLEGDVEILQGEERSARADALLLDLRENTGYMQNAEVLTSIDVFGKRERVRTRASALQMSANGSLHAKNATLTSCTFAEPHYVVRTGELTLDPRVDGGWRVSAHENRLRFGESGIQLPLPPIGGLVLDDDGDVKGFETSAGEVYGVQRMSAGDSARMGQEVNLGFQTEAGNVGLGVGKLAGFKSKTVRGRWKYDGSYLGSRGVLLGIGLELREKDPNKPREEQAWLNLYASGLNDSGEDKGYVRVDEDDRDAYRAWYRARGRYPLSKDAWIDVALSTQTDPGVQSEFFERLYTRFEQRDNELHYRNADGSDYYQASVKVRVDDFRTEVEELPSAGYYHGSTPIGDIGSLALDYSGSVDVAYLRRKQGTIGDPSAAQEIEGFTEFSEAVFTDGLGDREVARIDSSQQLQAPFGLGVAGIHARPFLDAELTAWDRGAVEEDEPARAGFFGGMELSTTVWRRTSGSLTSLSPHAGYAEELAIHDGGGDPVRFDSVDDPIDGDRMDAGVRARWEKLASPHSLDVDLREISRTDRTEAADAERVFAALAEMRTEIVGVPVALRHDSRYDMEEEENEYWRSAIGLVPHEDLQLEFAYTRGPIVHDPDLADALRIPVDTPRYEATSGRMRYRMTPKWEIEVSQSYSLSGNARLDGSFTLRRFGHDFIIELGLATRSGEGASFEVSFQPLVGWRPKRLGLFE